MPRTLDDLKITELRKICSHYNKHIKITNFTKLSRDDLLVEMKKKIELIDDMVHIKKINDFELPKKKPKEPKPKKPKQPKVKPEVKPEEPNVEEVDELLEDEEKDIEETPEEWVSIIKYLGELGKDINLENDKVKKYNREDQIMYFYYYIEFKYKKNCYIIEPAFTEEALKKYSPKNLNFINNSILYHGAYNKLFNNEKIGVHKIELPKGVDIDFYKNIINMKRWKKEKNNIYLPFYLDKREHANTLLINLTKGTLERFEPLGKQRDKVIKSTEKKLSEDLELEFLPSNMNAIGIHLNTDKVKKYIKDEDAILASSHGIQYMENLTHSVIKNIQTGFCMYWSLFFLELMLKNPHLDSQEIMINIVNVADSNPLIIMKMIYAYTKNLNKEVLDILGENFGNDMLEAFDTFKKHFGGEVEVKPEKPEKPEVKPKEDNFMELKKKGQQLRKELDLFFDNDLELPNGATPEEYYKQIQEIKDKMKKINPDTDENAKKLHNNLEAFDLAEKIYREERFLKNIKNKKEQKKYKQYVDDLKMKFDDFKSVVRLDINRDLNIKNIYGFGKKGEGFFSDIKDKVVGTVKNIFSPITDRFTKNSQKTLNKYGNEKIFKIYAFRQPLNKIIEKAVNIISLGKFDKGASNINKLYHLGLYVQLENGTDIIIEKNETPDIFVGKPKYEEMREIPIHDTDLTINKMLENTLKKVNNNQIFVYSGMKNNCQQFVRDVLQSNNMWNSDLDKFIYQDIKKATENVSGFSQKIINSITTGANIGKKLIRQGEPEFEQYLELHKDLVKNKKDRDLMYKIWLKSKPKN
jgi:hypothetical protein